MIKHGLAIFWAILLAGCMSTSSLQTPSMPTTQPTPSPQPPATPTLQPAVEYTEGLGEIPPGKFLFVEYWDTSDGTSITGQCEGAAMIDFPGYSFGSGELDAPNLEFGRGWRNSFTPPIGFFGVGRNNQGAMGGGASSELNVIDTLPYVPPSYAEPIIHSVDAEGAIVAEVGGETYFIKPGESWIQQFGSYPSPLCHQVTTSRLTNYGLLDKSQIRTPQDLRNALGSPHRLVWSTDGKQLIFAGTTGVIFYSTSPLAAVDRWTTTFDVLNLALSPNGRMLAFSGSDNAIHLRSMASDAAHELVLTDPPGPWMSLAFSPDGSILAAGSQDGIIQLWDSTTGQAIGEPWMDRMQKVSSLSYSPDGKFLLTDEDWMLRIWDTDTGQVSRAIRTMELSGTVSYDAIWSPDGKTIAWGSHPFQDGKVLGLLDAATGGFQSALIGQACAVWNIAYSPNTKLIGAGSDCGTVQVWDVKTGVLQGQWTFDGKGHTVIVGGIAFSPDSKQVAAYDLTIPSQQTIRLINLETGETTQVNPDQQ